jgi:hypothetical protein
VVAGLLGGLVGFILGLFCFIALMCIWGNTGKTQTYLFELLQYRRIDRGLDPLTGKIPKQKK